MQAAVKQPAPQAAAPQPQQDSKYSKPQNRPGDMPNFGILTPPIAGAATSAESQPQPESKPDKPRRNPEDVANDKDYDPWR